METNNIRVAYSRNRVLQLREYANTQETDCAFSTAPMCDGVNPSYIPDDVYKHLPPVLKDITGLANSKDERDMLLLGTLACLSAAFPNVHSVYDGRRIYPNLFLFVTAPAGVGKGALNYCRDIIMPIHRHLREKAEKEEKEYKKACAAANNRNNNKDAELIEEPPMRMFLIPANSSAASFQKILGDNDGVGLMFETEGDTLSQTFKRDYGQYSDILRKAFHHEPISISRKANREYLEIQEPKLSVVLAGTPKQVNRLIPDEEDGLMSRFMFYCVPFSTETRDVFAKNGAEKLKRFREIGIDMFRRIDAFKDFEYIFRIREEDECLFTAFQESTTEQCVSVSKSMLATARRLPLIGYRIMMMLTILRALDSESYMDMPFTDAKSELTCSTDDFTLGIMIMSCLTRHSIQAFQLISTSNVSSSPKTRDRFFESLPISFTREEYDDQVERMGHNVRSSEYWIKKYITEGKLERLAQGEYRKVR